MILKESEFINWHKKHTQISIPLDLSKYYDISVSKHKPLIEKFGDDKYVYKAEIENTENFLSNVKCIQYHTRMSNLIGPMEKFAMPSGYPTDQNGKVLESYLQSDIILFRGKKYKTTTVLRKQGEINGLSPQKMREFNVILSELGAEWAKIKTKKAVYYVHILWGPQHFSLIGRSCVDGESCFKDGSVNESHKYIIGMNDNTFVGYISHAKDLDVASADTKMRFFGQIDLENKRFHTFNKYPRTPSSYASVLEAIKNCAGDILGLKSVSVTQEKLRVKPIFQNPSETSTYHDSAVDLEDRKTIELDVPKTGEPYVKCMTCGKFGLLEGMKVVSNYLYCNICAVSGGHYKCDLTKEYYKGAATRVNYKGKNINVSKDTVLDQFRQCCYSGEYYHISEITKLKPEKYVATIYKDKIKA